MNLKHLPDILLFLWFLFIFGVLLTMVFPALELGSFIEVMILLVLSCAGTFVFHKYKYQK